MIPRSMIALIISGSLPVLFALAADNANPDRVIAQSEIGAVHYRVVECIDPALSAMECHAREQRQLTRRLQEQWITAAAKTYTVVLTDEEQAMVTRQVASEKDHFAGAALHFHALAVAALEVRRGKDPGLVVPELAKDGVTAKELEWELAHFPTIRDAERAAAIDYFATSEESGRVYLTRRFILQHLQTIVTKRSANEHVSFDVAEERFWSEIAGAIHMRIIDSAFEMPEKKGILVNP